MKEFPDINKVEGSVPLPEVEEKLKDIRQKNLEDFKDIEIIPTKEELQIIDAIVFGLQVMFKYVYDIDCKQILKEKIHIVKEGTLGEYRSGMHRLPSGDIYLEPLISCGSKIVFAHTLAHELVHYLSFFSIKTSKKEGKVKITPHVSGLGILKFDEVGSIEYFDILDEALTMYISNEFLRLELDRSKREKGRKTIYANECLAVDTILEWVHHLPNSIDIDKTEWDHGYVSIPFAEEIAKVIESNISTEEKVKFYKEKIGEFHKANNRDYNLERMWEFNDVTNKIGEMFSSEESDPDVVKEKTFEFINKLVSLKLTGQGFLDTVRFVEKRLGRGSFKKLAEHLGTFQTKGGLIKK